MTTPDPGLDALYAETQAAPAPSFQQRLGANPALAAMWEKRKEGIEARAQLPAQESRAIRKVHYTHDAMIDMLIENPTIKQTELAAMFGYTDSWVSIVMASDAFQARLAARKAELVDPTIRISIEERFKAIATTSLQRLQEKLQQPNPSDNLVLAAAALASKSLGIGQTPATPPSDPGKLERIADRLQGLLGKHAIVRANATIDQEVIDALPRPIAVEQPSPTADV